MLNVYAHVTDEMRQKAADCIDRGIAGAEPSSKHAESKPGSSTFQAIKEIPEAGNRVCHPNQ